MGEARRGVSEAGEGEERPEIKREAGGQPTHLDLVHMSWARQVQQHILWVRAELLAAPAPGMRGQEVHLRDGVVRIFARDGLDLELDPIRRSPRHVCRQSVGALRHKRTSTKKKWQGKTLRRKRRVKSPVRRASRYTRRRPIPRATPSPPSAAEYLCLVAWLPAPLGDLLTESSNLTGFGGDEFPKPEFSSRNARNRNGLRGARRLYIGWHRPRMVGTAPPCSR